MVNVLFYLCMLRCIVCRFGFGLFDATLDEFQGLVIQLYTCVDN